MAPCCVWCLAAPTSRSWIAACRQSAGHPCDDRSVTARSRHEHGGPTFSIVIPVYNEVESLDELLRSVDSAMPRGHDYEIVFVDDGSTDGSFQKLKTLAESRPGIRLFSFRRNLGKSAALTCGFQRAAGQLIVTLDADLQDDPREYRDDAPVSAAGRPRCGQRMAEEPPRLAAEGRSSKIFNLLVIRTLFGVPFHDMNSGLKLYRAEVARALMLYGGMHRFIPLILAAWATAWRRFPSRIVAQGTAGRSTRR